MTERQDLARHLAFFAEIGVAGVSRDPAWRVRDDGALPMEAGASPRRGSGQVAPADVAGSKEPASMSTFTSPVPNAESPVPDPAGALQALRSFIGPCTRCKLHALGRTQVVFGVGNPRARLMFVGEAPGADEDRQGEPFVGRAGQLLTKIIEGGLQLKRSDVYIANVIKCRPPGNRNPEPDEVATCQPFLFQQIDLIRPRVIVALGTFAAHALLQNDAPISRLRGHVLDFRGGSKLIPTFHPAFLLRSPERKRDVWEDMKKVRALLAEQP
jgi:uracil-DNA glycosylase